MTDTAARRLRTCRRSLVASVVAAGLVLSMQSPTAAMDPAQLAAQIDRHLAKRFDRDDIIPAPAADDAEFLRRLHLDLIGRPPTPDDVRRFLANSAPHKRDEWVDALLGDRRHAEHFASTWRALLLPEADSDRQIRYFQAGFEAWLRDRRLEGAGFDALVSELLSVPIAGTEQPPQVVLRDLKAPNPMAFIAAKGGDPAAIASSATRLFLGLRLECAQCHDHPFDAWTREQFWNQAAFFAGIERRGRSPFSPLSEARDRREMPVMGTGQTVPAVFLDGAQPALDDNSNARALFARWMTAPDNPWFSRAVVNRIWAQLMGEGFVDPVDDFGSNNPPSHPELLDELAEAFARSGFDLTFLYGAICRSKAYRRTSRTTHASQQLPQTFARMAVKPMTAEQFFAVLAQAIGYERQSDRSGAGRNEDRFRRRVLSRFPSSIRYTDPDTSVSQALTLMNGQLTRSPTASESPLSVVHLQQQSDLSSAGQIEQLYLLALSRLPTQQESAELTAHLENGENSSHPQRLEDVLWVLLNTAEFRWNH